VDLNYLENRQQMSLRRAREATCERSRLVHLTLAQGYADRIARYRAAQTEAGAA